MATTETKKPALVEPFYPEAAPVGNLVHLQPGDILAAGPKGLELVIRVTESGAKIRPLGRRVRTITNRLTDESKTISGTYDDFNTCNTREPETIIRRMGVKWLNNFLAGNAALDEDLQQQTSGGNGNTMNKDTTKKPARGGLAARKRDTENTNGEPTSKGQLGECFGHSITSAIRAMGKAGMVWQQAKTALQAKKLTPSDTTLKIQINRHKGKNAQDPAPLTKEQLTELKELGGDAPAPKAKAEKKVKATKKAEPEPEQAKAA